MQDARGREAFTAPNAEWKAQSLYNTQGGCCWLLAGGGGTQRARGVHGGPGPPQQPHFWGQGQTASQGQVELDPRMPGRSGGVQGLRGTPWWSVVKPLGPSGLTRPQCSRRARLHLWGRCVTSRVRPAAHLAGGRVRPARSSWWGALREVPAVLCPQAPPFIFCKTDNHGPQELPTGSVDTSLASCLATDHQLPCTHTSSPPPRELGAQGGTHTVPRP